MRRYRLSESEARVSPTRCWPFQAWRRLRRADRPADGRAREVAHLPTCFPAGISPVTRPTWSGRADIGPRCKGGTRMSSVNITRRQALKGSLVLPLIPSVSSAAASAETAIARHDGAVLVAYFTRTGNTRLIATQIARALGAPLFQIVPAVAY